MNRSGWALAGLFLLAVGLRIVCNPEPATLAGDAAGYHQRAVDLSAGRGYLDADGRPTAFKAPGYPFFLSGIYRLFGQNHRAVVWIQALLGGIVVLAGAALGRRIGGCPAGWLTGLLIAVSPPLVRLSGTLLTENLALFLLMLMGWLGGVWADRRHLLRAIVWGILCAALVLTRPGMGLLVPAAAAAAAWHRLRRPGPESGRLLRQVLCAGVIACSLIGLWTIRNHRQLGRWVPISTDGGRALYSAVIPLDGVRYGFSADDAAARRIDRLPDEVDRDRAYRRAAWDRLRRAPGRLPAILGLRLGTLLVPWDWEIIARDGTARYNWLYGLLFPWILWGAWQIRRTGHAVVLIGIPLGVLLLQTLLFYGSPRFRLPFEPFLLLLGALGWIAFWGERRPVRWKAGLGIGWGLLQAVGAGMIARWRGW